MYLFPLNIEEKIMMKAISQMRNEKVAPEELADYIKTNIQVGIEFDQYFKLKRNKNS